MNYSRKGKKKRTPIEFVQIIRQITGRATNDSSLNYYSGYHPDIIIPLFPIENFTRGHRYYIVTFVTNHHSRD